MLLLFVTRCRVTFDKIAMPSEAPRQDTRAPPYAYAERQAPLMFYGAMLRASAARRYYARCFALMPFRAAALLPMRYAMMAAAA